MALKAEAKLLRVLLGEADNAGHTALYGTIAREARKLGRAGADFFAVRDSYPTGAHAAREYLIMKSLDEPAELVGGRLSKRRNRDE